MLKHFVPIPVMYHCDFETLDLEWLEEVAHASVMFVTFQDDIADLDGIQNVFRR